MVAPEATIGFSSLRCHHAPEATKTYGSGGWTALYYQGPWWHHWHRKGHRHKGQPDRRREDVDADEQGEESKVFGKEGRRHCISSSAKIQNPDYLGHFFCPPWLDALLLLAPPQFLCVMKYLMWWFHLMPQFRANVML